MDADPADIALIPSISYGVATAAKLLTILRGGRVLVLENDHSSPVLEWQTRAVAQEGIYVAPRLGRMRISPHVFNYEADADRFVAALGRRLRN